MYMYIYIYMYIYVCVCVCVFRVSAFSRPFTNGKKR